MATNETDLPSVEYENRNCNGHRKACAAKTARKALHKSAGMRDMILRERNNKDEKSDKEKERREMQ